MTKPITHIDWLQGNGSVGTRIETPTGALTLNGYSPSDTPKSKNFNFLFYYLDQWDRWAETEIDSLTAAVAGKQDSGNYLTALTGEVTASGPGSAAATIAAGAVTDSKVASNASIAYSKMAALSASKVMVTDGSGVAAASSIASSTLAFLDATSSIQTQLDAKQPLDVDLTAIAALSSTGIAVRTALNTWAQRSIAAGTGISVTNGDGVSGNPTVAIDSTVATLTGSQILTNKTLDTPVIDNSAIFNQETTPANPAAGKMKFYPKSDGFFYSLDPSGVETQVGAGSGLGTGEVNAVSNPVAAIGTTGWTNATRVTASSPLDPVVTTALSISNAAAAESSTSGGYYSIATLASPLRSMKLKVEFWFTTPATDVYRVSMYAGSTRLSLSSDSSSVTTLPANTTGRFVATFDSTTATAYSLNVTRTSGTTGDCLITNVIVGPGVREQGAAVGPVTAFTPGTVQADTTAPTLHSAYTWTAYYARSGEFMNVQMNYRATNNAGVAAGSGIYLFPIPAGFTINPNYLGSGNGLFNTYGDAEVRIDTANYRGQVGIRAKSGVYYLIITALTGFSGTANPANGTFTGGGNVQFSTYSTAFEFTLNATIPINEWAGNGTLNLGAGAQVEYAYNTDTSSTASVTASGFAYGPDGIAFSSNFVVGTTWTRRVRFQYPIQTDDLLLLEVNDGTGWQPLDQRLYGISRQGATDYGAQARYVSGSTTDVDVVLLPGGARGDNATYAGNGTGFSSFTTFKWRVRKVKASSPVGFGLASTDGSSGLYKAGQAPGYTGGSAIPAGYVGEILSQTTTTAITTSAANLATVTLTAGVWTVSGGCNFSADTVTRYMRLSISSTTNTTDTVSGRVVNADYHTTAGIVSACTFPRTFNVASGSTLPVYLVGFASSISGLGSTNSYIEAVRIA